MLEALSDLLAVTGAHLYDITEFDAFQYYNYVSSKLYSWPFSKSGERRHSHFFKFGWAYREDNVSVVSTNRQLIFVFVANKRRSYIYFCRYVFIKYTSRIKFGNIFSS